MLTYRIADLMETIVSEYVEELVLPDGQPNVMETFTSMTDEITYTGFKVHLCAKYYRNTVTILILL